MLDNGGLAEDLTASLKLARPPIAVAFSDTSPADIPLYEGVAPAFVTSSKDHALCAIGIYTHHLAEPAGNYAAELEEALAVMNNLNYVRPSEVAALPVIKDRVAHIVYGPLSRFPLAANVVILFAHAQQSLILSEAVTRVDGGIPPAMGRPACAMIPQAINHGNAAMSLGCCGARAYLDSLTNDISMWALPGAKLEQYRAEIAGLARANQTLTTFHLRRRADVESGKQPTVKESLARLAHG